MVYVFALIEAEEAIVPTNVRFQFYSERCREGTDGADEGIQQDTLFFQPHLAAFRMLRDVGVADLELL